MSGLHKKDDFILHESPQWGDRADFIIHAPIEHEGRQFWEQLWCRKVEVGFEICCIPWFTYGLSLGDLVSTSSFEDKQYVFHKIIRKSGHHTYRIWFSATLNSKARIDVIDKIISLGALVERRSYNLVGLSSPCASTHRLIEECLAKYQAGGFFELDDGESQQEQ